MLAELTGQFILSIYHVSLLSNKQMTKLCIQDDKYGASQSARGALFAFPLLMNLSLAQRFAITESSLSAITRRRAVLNNSGTLARFTTTHCRPLEDPD